MVDWWSLGCLIFEMLAGRKVFMIPKNNALTPELYKKKIDFPDYLSKEAVDIITKFLEYNPKNRLGYGTNGINDIKNHQFFKNINWNEIYNKNIKVDEKYIPYFFENKMDLKNFDTIFTNEKLNESLESLNSKIQFVILNIKRFHL
jgi:protein-serine/threonine kinase